MGLGATCMIRRDRSIVIFLTVKENCTVSIHAVRADPEFWERVGAQHLLKFLVNFTDVFQTAFIVVNFKQRRHNQCGGYV
jgi:hypothetical protein